MPPEQKFTFPYLFDGETQAIAKAYGCLATPHVFLFDKERKLRYQGRFDDSRYADDASVTAPDARNAVEALLAEKDVPVAETKPHGCTTKWIEKRQGVASDNEKWEKGSVEVETITPAGIAELRKNDHQEASPFQRVGDVVRTLCGGVSRVRHHLSGSSACVILSSSASAWMIRRPSPK
jgi:hypothetical protein